MAKGIASISYPKIALPYNQKTMARIARQQVAGALKPSLAGIPTAETVSQPYEQQKQVVLGLTQQLQKFLGGLQTYRQGLAQASQQGFGQAAGALDQTAAAQSAAGGYGTPAGAGTTAPAGATLGAFEKNQADEVNNLIAAAPMQGVNFTNAIANKQSAALTARQQSLAQIEAQRPGLFQKALGALTDQATKIQTANARDALVAAAYGIKGQQVQNTADYQSKSLALKGRQLEFQKFRQTQAYQLGMAKVKATAATQDTKTANQTRKFATQGIAAMQKAVDKAYTQMTGTSGGGKPQIGYTVSYTVPAPTLHGVPVGQPKTGSVFIDQATWQQYQASTGGKPGSHDASILKLPAGSTITGSPKPATGSATTARGKLNVQQLIARGAAALTQWSDAAGGLWDPATIQRMATQYALTYQGAVAANAKQRRTTANAHHHP